MNTENEMLTRQHQWSGMRLPGNWRRTLFISDQEASHMKLKKQDSSSATPPAIYSSAIQSATWPQLQLLLSAYHD